MDVRLATEALLRAHHTLLHSFRPALETRVQTLRRFPISSNRAFSVRSFQYAQNPEAEEQEPSSKPTSSNSTSDTSRLADDIQNILDQSLDGGSKPLFLSGSGSSRYKTPSAQSQARRGKQSDGLAIEQDSFNSAQRDFGAEFSPRPSPSSADTMQQAVYEWASSRRIDRQRQRGRFLDTNQLEMPVPSSDSPVTELVQRPSQIREPTIKLGPSVGRTVAIEPGVGVDLARGFTMLSMLCARNKVQYDSRRQRFHERPGLKRKRLKSERWRKRFREGFQAVVRRVEKLKKQGW